MVRNGFILLILCTLMVGLSSASFATSQTLVFTRHGEKPFLDYGQLICQGWNRALHLPQVLFNKFGKPDALFAPHPYHPSYYYYVRGVVTLSPLAIQLDMPIHKDYLYFEIDKIVADLLQPKYQSATVFVIWEHLNLVKVVKKIIRNLGADEKIVPKWSHTDFDSIFVVKIDWSSNPPKVQFSHQQEQLNDQSNQCYIPQYVDSSVSERRLLFLPSAEAKLGADQLSCKGLNRALLLSSWFSMYISKINRIILPKPDQQHLYLKSLMTIEPTLIKRGGSYIPEGKTTMELIRDFSSRINCCETVVIAWDIENLGFVLQSIYQAQGGDPNEIENPVVDHDVVYEIVLKTGKKPKLYKHPTYLKNISDQCPLAS